MKLRERTIYELSCPTFDGHLTAVDRIILARKFSIVEWLASAYTELCTRKLPLQQDEIERLGGQATSRLAEVRERLLADAVGYAGHGERMDSIHPTGSREQTSSIRVQLLIDEVFSRT